MQALFQVILPVFLVLGAGYLTVWRGYLDGTAIDALMTFAQGIAVPCLLFLGVAQMDLGQAITAPLFLSFFTGALVAFILGGLAAFYIFGRPAWRSALPASSRTRSCWACRSPNAPTGPMR